MWTRAACGLSAEKLRELSRSVVAILLFPVISETVLSLTPNHQNDWPRPHLHPRPVWAHLPHTHTDRLTYIDLHTLTLTVTPTQTHTHTLMQSSTLISIL